MDEAVAYEDEEDKETVPRRGETDRECRGGGAGSDDVGGSPISALKIRITPPPGTKYPQVAVPLWRQGLIIYTVCHSGTERELT